MDYTTEKTEHPMLGILPPVQIGKLAHALAKAQAVMRNPPKTKTARIITKKGEKYSYTYADLADVIEAIREPLAANGLAWLQLVETANTTAILKTVLLHESGESVCSTYPLPFGAAAQEMGSAITYARRYSLSAMLGLAAETDDDGAGAESAPTHSDRDRDELVERMGSASLGNEAIMAAAKAMSLGDGRTIADLSGKAVTALLDRWDEVVDRVKRWRELATDKSLKSATPAYGPASAPGNQPKPTADATTKPEATETPEDKAAEIPAQKASGAGIAPGLVALMKQSEVKPAMLKAYYVSKGHYPDSVEPKDLPEVYIKKLIAAWPKALPNIKKGA